MIIAYFILGVGLLIGLVLLGRWFADAEPRQVKHVLIWLGGLFGVAAALLLVWAGRHGLAALLLPMLLPAIMSLRRRLGPARTGPKPSGDGDVSEIDTELLRMSLDHESGVLSGEVKGGRFAGKRLDQLSLDELLQLWSEFQRDDPDGATLLEGYLERVHGPGWRTGSAAGGAEGASSGPMTPEEARAILGVGEGASEEDIRTAYRRLMQKLHPDHGGSTYLASQLNEAKRLLLREG